jgi:restriction endonuclease Mrr
VRPHERGKNKQEVVYRSRSALQALYEAAPELSGEGHPDRWFQFERDVYGLMAALGFEVEHIAASGRGDRGVDVFARKGTDLDTVHWVIQCKCFGKRKVGPGIVRELVGALELGRDKYPPGTRGMIVTTSSFSAEAVNEATLGGIRLIDGSEFVNLVSTATSN